jgi:hypothetical protein
MVRLRWWESVLGIVPLLIALLWIAGGLVVPGIVLLCLLAFAAASRASIVERQVAGAHARTRALIALTSSLALLAILGVVVALVWVIDQREWRSETPGLIAAYALVGLAIYLLRDVTRYADQAFDYFVGGRAERRVAQALEPLRELGWTIAHNIPRDGRGNLDHFVTGPTGSFAIETKSGRYRATDRGQVVSNAIWAKEKFGKRFVTAVLCVTTVAPEQPRKELHGNAEVWVLGPSQLCPWLLAYRWVPKPRAYPP